MLKRLNIYFKEMYPILPRLGLGYLIAAEIYFIVLLNHGVTWDIIAPHLGIQELVLASEKDVLAAIKGLMLSLSMEEARLTVPDYEQVRISSLTDVCEEYTIAPNEDYLIFDYAVVIRAYLQVKTGYCPLPDGEICLGLGGKSITVSVKDSCPDVTETPEKSPVLTMTDPEAAAFLLAHLSTKRTTLRREYPFLDAWFPLPIYIDSVDAC